MASSSSSSSSNSNSKKEYLKEVRIIATGKAVPDPEHPLGNTELIAKCNLSDRVTEKWINEKIDIQKRFVCRDITTAEVRDQHKAKKGCKNSDLCAKAILDALNTANLSKSDLDMIICSTCTPDYPVPSNASIIQSTLEIPEIAVMDVRSACCGWTQGFITAMQYLRTGYYKTIVVVGAEVGSLFGCLNQDLDGYSRQDEVNAVMIGDAAACVILRGYEPNDPNIYGMEVMYINMNSIGMGKPMGMYLPLGGSIYPATPACLKQGLQYFKHDFRDVFRHGGKLYLEAMNDCLKQKNLSISDIDVFVPHQANAAISKKSPSFGVPSERVFHNFEVYGNVANASLPLCMDDLQNAKQTADGSLVMLAAAESTKWLWGVLLVRWVNLKGKSNKQLVKSRSWFFVRWGRSIMFRIAYVFLSAKSFFGF